MRIPNWNHCLAPDRWTSGQLVPYITRRKPFDLNLEAIGVVNEVVEFSLAIFSNQGFLKAGVLLRGDKLSGLTDRYGMSETTDQNKHVKTYWVGYSNTNLEELRAW